MTTTEKKTKILTRSNMVGKTCKKIDCEASVAKKKPRLNTA
jgi:hypothetical protein